jgi:hypothetical protein
MPFELGLAVAYEKSGGRHAWFVFESMDRRIMKSLSDLNGTDVYIHRGRLDGVFAQLGNAFLRTQPRPTVPQMQAIYRALRESVSGILHATGSNTLFAGRPFQELSAVAIGLTDEVVLGKGR